MLYRPRCVSELLPLCSDGPSLTVLRASRFESKLPKSNSVASCHPAVN